MIPRFRRINVKDNDLRLVQDSSEVVLTALISKSILDGIIVKDVAVGTSSTSIDHKLGRELIGWIVISKSSDSRVWDEQAGNTQKTKTLILKASSATTVSLWVF
jgi:hypothetical protein